MKTSTTTISGDRIFTFRMSYGVIGSFGEGLVDSSDHRRRIAHVIAAPDSEAELALCLRALVEARFIDIEKLRAALVLAEPIAQEAVAEAEERR